MVGFEVLRVVPTPLSVAHSVQGREVLNNCGVGQGVRTFENDSCRGVRYNLPRKERNKTRIWRSVPEIYFPEAREGGCGGGAVRKRERVELQLEELQIGRSCEGIENVVAPALAPVKGEVEVG